MRIKDQCPTDHQIISPQILLTDVYSFTQQPIKTSISRQIHTSSHGSNNEYTTLKQSRSIGKSVVRRSKKRDQQGLKRLIKQQKVKMIVNRFVQKLKVNNINSKPVIFEPYQIEERQSIYNIKGIELPDIYQKILSIFIAIYIMVCLFIDTTAALYPQLLSYPVIKVGQFTALVIFFVEFVSSCVVVKMVQGKKVDKISQIITNYISDGFFIDFAYLIILIVSFFTNVGNLRLIILLKLPECLQRIERIQNTYVNTFYKEQYWGLAKVFLLNFVLSHFLSLILVLMAEIQPTNSWLVKLRIQSAVWYEQYIWGYYWGTTIMLTVGFGDIAPANYQEAICIVMIETFSCLALAYNINCVGSLISNIKSQDVQKNKSIKTFKILSSRSNISEDLELKIHNYIQESTNIKKKFNFQEESKFISTLPNQLKADFLKQSNKKIFQNLVFFKNLTQKTLLSFAEVIQMKICHPQEVIKKRGQLSGLIIMKQGKIGFCTKLNSSNFSNVSIDKITVSQKNNPFLLSLDFISLQRSTYQVKSQQYSILYFLNMDKTLETLKGGQLDYQHFCFLRDRSRSFSNQYQVFKCQYCKTSYHTKFDCPKLHYCPLKKHVIDRYLFEAKISKNQRFKHFSRQKKRNFVPFKQLQNNLKIVDMSQNIQTKFVLWKKLPQSTQVNETVSNLTNFSISLKRQQPPQKQQAISLKIIHTLMAGQGKSSDNHHNERFFLNTIKNLQHQMLKQVLKDEISQCMVRNNEVWLLECDQIKNFKFYFSSYNASTLSYLNKKTINNSLFG